ncbi:uncharacterized protein LOC116927194 [Daphnia magna]|uniref:Uncharacterized protein n=1 Tax=Daphnia magna TaxID=35525 RepID=A0ABR0AND6_9CRUS|nr:uncharacterized protein LOC116927194 [Daphnia magna]KAK4026640.1 hypothetical protein OUZ56_015665 [Daphnia magna]
MKPSSYHVVHLFAIAFVLSGISCLPQALLIDDDVTSIGESDSVLERQMIPMLLNMSRGSASADSNVAEEYWSSGLSATANVKRFKAIRAGLLLNLNESVRDLTNSIKKNDLKEAEYYLRKMNDKWNRIESLQKTIIQLIPDDDLEMLVEESKLFEDNRDVVDRQREMATNFLLKTVR